MWGAVARYLKQLRVAYMLLALAAVLAAGLLAVGGGDRAARHPTPLSIAGPEPRACATMTGHATQEMSVTVRREASVILPVSVTAARSATVRGRGGAVRATATATERVNLAQTATATAHLAFRLRASARVSACAVGRTSAGARAQARVLADRGARIRAQRLLRMRAPWASLAAQRRAAPRVLARALALAQSELRGRVGAARASALSTAGAAAQRDAARHAHQAAGV